MRREKRYKERTMGKENTAEGEGADKKWSRQKIRHGYKEDTSTVK